MRENDPDRERQAADDANAAAHNTRPPKPGEPMGALPDDERDPLPGDADDAVPEDTPHHG